VTILLPMAAEDRVQGGPLVQLLALLGGELGLELEVADGQHRALRPGNRLDLRTVGCLLGASRPANPAGSVLRTVPCTLFRSPRPMQTHVKIVALINIVRGLIVLLGAVGVLFGGVFGSLFTEGILSWLVISVASVIGSAIMAAFGAFAVFAGIALLNYRPWARWLTIVMACFGLFKFPVGTLISGYTLWVLFSDETRALFANR
jgi:hypothetical protein